MKSMKYMRKIAIMMACILIFGLAVTGVSGATNGTGMPKILLPENSFHVTLPLVSSGSTTNILILKSDKTELMNTQLQIIQVPVSPESYSVTLLPISTKSLIKGFSWLPALPQSTGSGTTTSYTPVAPVTIPANDISATQAGSGSGLGGLIILGPDGKYTISMRSNFYDPSQLLYNGMWHVVGVTPRYWYNMFLPGSYTIQLANRTTGQVVYCETVTVNAGMNTTVQAGAGVCPFAASCPDCC
jgi:hypothetical protein